MGVGRATGLPSLAELPRPISPLWGWEGALAPGAPSLCREPGRRVPHEWQLRAV